MDIIKHSDGKDDIMMTPEVEKAMSGLRKFLFKEVYENPKVRVDSPKAVFVLEQIYAYYLKDPEGRLPKDHLARYQPDNPYSADATAEDMVCDYVAGMTDGYVVNLFKELFLPKEWND